MANKIKPRQRLLFLGETDPATDSVVCITQIQTSESSSDINADSFCGDDSLPGTDTASLTIAAQMMEGPGAGTNSYLQIKEWKDNKTPLYFRIARAAPAAGQIEQKGECFVQQITTSDDLNAVTTFNLTLKVDGNIAAYLRQTISLTSVATANENANQGTDEILYDILVDASEDYDIDDATVVLSGTFDSNDITAVKLMANSSKSTVGATTLATDNTGITSGATLNFGAVSGVDKTKTHLMIVATIAVAATTTQTIKSGVPVFEFPAEISYTNGLTDNGGTFDIHA